MKFEATKKDIREALLREEGVGGEEDRIVIKGEPVEDKCECRLAAREDFHKCFEKEQIIEEMDVSEYDTSNVAKNRRKINEIIKYINKSR